MNDDPDKRNPLGPYYPSEVPDVPSTGRRWVALVLLFSILIGGVGLVIDLVFNYL